MVRTLAWVAVTMGAGAVGPSAWCQRGAGAWFEGDPAVVEPFAAIVARQVESPLGDFGTGSARFDGEWRFGTYQMAALGFGQAALQDPAHRDVDVERMHRAVDHLLDPSVFAFDRDAWGDDVLAHLATDPHDHAVLGYLGLALSLERLVDPVDPHLDVEEAVARHLSRRLAARGKAPFETYPGEAFPVDASSVLGALALHARATGRPVPDEVVAALRHWESAYVAEDGLVYQTVDPRTGRPNSRVRGSGTALSAYFLGFAAPALSLRVGAAVKRELAGTVAGFGAVREYRRGVDGSGDIDSGPLVDGWSISATGFSLAAARTASDASWFADLYGTACLVGVPTDEGFLTGGPLGDAILFAMATALPAVAP